MQPIPLQKDTDRAKAILPTFRAWAFYSKAADYGAMYDLCLSGSGFAEFCGICSKGGEIGIRYFYEFEDLEVVFLSNDREEAIVKGVIRLIQFSENISMGRFTASVHSAGTGLDVQNTHKLKAGTGNWKLGDVDIDWVD